MFDLYMGLLPSYAVFAYNRQQQIHTGDCKQFNESLKRASQLYALFSHKQYGERYYYIYSKLP